MINKRDTLQKTGGVAVVYLARTREPEHEKTIHLKLAEKLATLQGLEFAGEYSPRERYGGRVYFIPTDTVIGLDKARNMGMNSERDLFGGVAPHPFVATKAITHSLLHRNACAPPGWSSDFGRQVCDSVLRGTTAFTLDDARAAGRHLLERGPVRVKPVRATGGRGQSRVDSPRALDEALRGMDRNEISQFGLVLEEHLDQVHTYSVGQVLMAHQVASYFGTQRLTRDNKGDCVYGGSDLVIARGGFDSLLELDLPPHIRLAIAQAQVYDAAALTSFPGFFASRRNYDIAQGLDASGQTRSGVLEQSWRIGGASSAEVAGLEAFQTASAPRAIRASSIEIFGNHQRPPDHATVLFCGTDDETGFVTKCVTTETYDPQ